MLSMLHSVTVRLVVLYRAPELEEKDREQNGAP